MKKILLTIVVLTACLSYSISAGTPSPAGEIIAGGAAVVNRTSMPRGATIFSGDLVHAGTESTVLQLTNNGKIELYPGATARMDRAGNALTITVTQGKLAFYFPKSSRATLVLPHGSVMLDETSDRFYGSAETSPQQDTVEALQGRFILTNTATGQSAALEPGFMAHLLPNPQTATTGQGKKRLKSCEAIKNLVILYTTDSPATPLAEREWTPVTEMVNGFQDEELLEADKVYDDGRVEGENHVSSAPDYDGWASLTFVPVDATGVAIEFENAQPKKRSNTYHVDEFQAYLDEIMIEDVLADAWPNKNTDSKRAPEKAVDGDKTSTTWSTKPTNKGVAHLGLGFRTSQKVNRIRLWKGCSLVPILIAQDPAIIIVPIVGGAVLTGIILYEVIKEEDDASPS